MTTRNNSSDIKRRNKTAVLRELIRVGETTKPELAISLRLSLPTVGQMVGELIASGFAEENGRTASGGGRRPVSIRVAAGKWIALGISITAHHMVFALVDLNGTVIHHERTEALFAPDMEYHALMQERLTKFLARNEISRENLMGVGITFPGIVSSDQSSLLYSHAFHLKSPMRFVAHEYFSCPVRYFNDAAAACMVECCADDAPDSFIFLSLSNTVGGAIVINKTVVEGDHHRSGELGHVCVVPGGRLCYCGKKGHYDAYGAAWLLAEKAGGDLAGFFNLAAAGHPEATAVLEEYLDMLALLICNIVMANDLPMIIGGYVGNYLEPYLPRLKQKVAEQDIFGEDDPDIRLCRRKEEAAATGAAMYFLEQQIKNL